MNTSFLAARQLALNILYTIEQQQTYTDIALDRGLRQASLTPQDRGLVTELVYGITRQRRSLNTLIDQFAHQKSQRQPPKFRLILQLGFYQLRYLDQIPPSAAVHTSVELAKKNGFPKLSGVVNGILRQYIRLSQDNSDPLILPSDPIQKIAIAYSYPDWLIQLWVNELGQTETQGLCQWFNQVPTIDLRINSLKTDLETVKQAFTQAHLSFKTLDQFPQTLRLMGNNRQIPKLPGFKEGWWTVQDASAQLVSYLLDPQPDEVIIDACAAPGGKTSHIAQLMGDQGTLLACDSTASRTRKIQQMIDRLDLKSVTVQTLDSRHHPPFEQKADRVLLDVPCSGLGTLHRHPDIRWQQNPQKIAQLSQIQAELLSKTANWLKDGGVLVYATCTLNHYENEAIIEAFLKNNPHWQIERPPETFPLYADFTPQGWLKILPHQHQMDGFFMVKLRKL